MPERLGPRFAVEASFLAVLAALAAAADLAWPRILAAMGGAWVFVAVYEWARWRERRP